MSTGLDQILQASLRQSETLSKLTINLLKRIDGHFYKDAATGFYGMLLMGKDADGNRQLLKVGTDGRVSTT